MKLKFVHGWNLQAKDALQLQKTFKHRITLKNHLNFKNMKYVAGADVAYCTLKNHLYAVVVLLKYPSLEMTEISLAHGAIHFPYIPGLLSFREAPILLKAFLRLRGKPDLIFIDGQGIAHPRAFGLASHIGLFLNKPTIGCAKSHLAGSYIDPLSTSASHKPLTIHKRKIGTVLRTKTDVKPLFISPGCFIDIPTAIQVTMACCKRKPTGEIKYRIPEPTRLADQFAKKFKNNPSLTTSQLMHS